MRVLLSTLGEPIRKHLLLDEEMMSFRYMTFPDLQVPVLVRPSEVKS